MPYNPQKVQQFNKNIEALRDFIMQMNYLNRQGKMWGDKSAADSANAMQYLERQGELSKENMAIDQSNWMDRARVEANSAVEKMPTLQRLSALAARASMNGDEAAAQKYMEQGKAITAKMASGLIEMFPQLKGTEVSELLMYMPENSFLGMIQQKMANYRQDRELVDNELDRRTTQEGHAVQFAATQARLAELSGKSPKDQFAAWSTMANDLNNFLETRSKTGATAGDKADLDPGAAGLMMKTVARVRANLANGQLPNKRDQEVLISFWDTNDIKSRLDVPTENTDMLPRGQFGQLLLSEKGPQLLLEYAERVFGKGAYTIEDIKQFIANMTGIGAPQLKKKKAEPGGFVNNLRKK